MATPAYRFRLRFINASLNPKHIPHAPETNACPRSPHGRASADACEGVSIRESAQPEKEKPRRVWPLPLAAYLVPVVVVGQTVPWSFLVTVARPL